MDDDFLAADDADARHLPRPRHIAAIGAVGGERRQLQERRARIEQRLDAIAHEHLALPRQPFPIALRPVMPRGALAFGKIGGDRAVGRVIGGEIGAAHVDA